jgi:hypothetical protein
MERGADTILRMLALGNIVLMSGLTQNRPNAVAESCWGNFAQVLNVTVVFPSCMSLASAGLTSPNVNYIDAATPYCGMGWFVFEL